MVPQTLHSRKASGPTGLSGDENERHTNCSGDSDYRRSLALGYSYPSLVGRRG